MPIGKHATSLPQIPGGKYTVKFHDFWPEDADHIPTLASNGTQIRYHVYIVGGPEDGKQAPGSLDATEANLKLLVKAFGGDSAKVSLDLTDVGSSLTLANAVIRKAAKVLNCTVGSSGWIANLEGLNVPPGNYLLKFGGITSKDNLGVISWKENEGQYGKTKRVQGNLIVVGDEYDGNRLGFSLDYPFVVNPETGLASWRVNQKGEFLKASKRWDNFFKVFGVDLEYFDVEKAQNQENLTPEMFDLIYQHRDLVVAGTVGDSGWLDVDKLTPLPKGVSVAPTPGKDSLVEAKKVLFEVITREVAKQEGAPAAFRDDGSLSDVGRKWSVDNIKPTCKELGIPTSKFSEMTVENIEMILRHLGFAEDADKLAF